MGHQGVIHLDTHVLVRLHQGRAEAIGSAGRRAIERHDLVASPATVLELEILHEIGRLKPNAATVIKELAADFGLRVCELPFRSVVEHAVHEGWTREPFDRLIVGNAKAAGAALVTADKRIAKHYDRALW